MSTRRGVLRALGIGVLALPFGLHAQQRVKTARIGYFSYTAQSVSAPYLDAFKRGMAELGYVEGKSYLLDVRSADGKADRLPVLAAELVQLKLDIIVVASAPAARAVLQATRSIPIVMATMADPVRTGLIKSLARPGGNVTGLSDMTGDLSGKNLDLIKIVVPRLSRIAVLTDRMTPASVQALKDIDMAAHASRLKVISASASNPSEIEAAFVFFSREHAEAMIVTPSTFFLQQERQILDLSTKSGLPSIGIYRGYAEAGGLMAYGPNFQENFRRAATYVDKILKGANPGDLPVEQPMTLELVINRKTAKSLGLTIPQELLLRADKVIE